MMKQVDSCGSLDSLIPISRTKEEKISKSKQVYSREFQAMLDSLDEEDCVEGASHGTEKKRRLTTDQVRALEKNFEVENKLEPERKVKLAEELGLQPRQVAIWFQNRRARWKTKQLEKDYSLLKTSYDTLKLEYNNLEQEKQTLTAKVKELKAKLKEDKSSESSYSVKEVSQNFPHQTEEDDLGDNGDSNGNFFKEECNANAHLLISPSSSSSLHHFNGTSQFSESASVHWSKSSFDSNMTLGNVFQPHQLVKVDEQFPFSAEESCNIFSVDQSPTLHWYFTGQ